MGFAIVRDRVRRVLAGGIVFAALMKARGLQMGMGGGRMVRCGRGVMLDRGMGR
mgnify:CR=1 FL=1